MRRRLAQDFDIAAPDAESMQQRMHRELRMVRRRRLDEFALRVFDATDQLPRVVVEIGVQPWQHHRALRESGNGVEEFCGCRHGSGRAWGNDGTSVMRS